MLVVARLIAACEPKGRGTPSLVSPWGWRPIEYPEYPEHVRRLGFALRSRRISYTPVVRFPRQTTLHPAPVRCITTPPPMRAGARAACTPARMPFMYAVRRSWLLRTPLLHQPVCTFLTDLRLPAQGRTRRRSLSESSRARRSSRHRRSPSAMRSALSRPATRPTTGAVWVARGSCGLRGCVSCGWMSVGALL